MDPSRGKKSFLYVRMWHHPLLIQRCVCSMQNTYNRFWLRVTLNLTLIARNFFWPATGTSVWALQSTSLSPGLVLLLSKLERLTAQSCLVCLSHYGEQRGRMKHADTKSHGKGQGGQDGASLPTESDSSHYSMRCFFWAIEKLLTRKRCQKKIKGELRRINHREGKNQRHPFTSLWSALFFHFLSYFYLLLHWRLTLRSPVTHTRQTPSHSDTNSVQELL